MMALDPWFQSWGPPSGVIQHFQTTFDLKNFTNFHGEPVEKLNSKKPRPDILLPYLFSFGLISPKEKQQKPKYLETTGPFKTWYQWSQIDFEYPSPEEREKAIILEEYIPKNNLPLGVEVYGDRMFVTMPKWKVGVPATLAVLPKIPRKTSPKLKPYPNWKWHRHNNCDRIVSVFRVQADICSRLWVLDSGLVEVTTTPKQMCPPKLLIFDLSNDELLVRYELPPEFIKQDGLYSNIVVDLRENDCHNVHAYLTDVWRFGIVVFSLEKMRGWRIYDHLFYPDPLASRYNLHNIEFDWTDGVFGLSLSPYDKSEDDRTLFFHPMSSFREFYVKTSVICNETGWMDSKNAFKVMGQSRGASGHVSASAIDRNGVMFYNFVTRDAVGCWDTRKPYKRKNLGVVAQDHEILVFPNDLKIDNEKRQSIWVLSNRLPYYLYQELDPKAVNFRIMSAYTDEAVEGSICDPRVAYSDTFEHFKDGADCY